MAAEAPQKGKQNLQVSLPQEVYRSRHFANMPKRYGQAEKTHADSILQTENKIVNLQERK